MPPFDVQEATIESIHTALRAKEISVAELVGAYLQRIDAHDRAGASLNSVVATSDHAVARAEELDAAFARSGELGGPLHGIPVVLKDNIETDDLPTTFGSIAMDGYRPPKDATVARRLRDAGAVVIAKTALPDWATPWFSYSSKTGDTRNPYDLDRDPGGSSAGTVAAAARLMDVLAGYDPEDPYSVAHDVARHAGSYAGGLDRGALRGARIGLVTNALGSEPAEAAEVNAVVQAAVAALRDAGATVVETEIPSHLA